MRRLVWLVLLLLLLHTVPVYGSSLPAEQRVGTTATDALIALERNPAVFDVLYRYGQIAGAPDGAYGPNVTAPRSAWFLEAQRAGATDLYDAVLRPNLDAGLAAAGLKLFHFGLARQSANGTFPGSAWPFHGTALFLAEAVPALVVFSRSALAAQFSAELGWEIPRLRRAAYAMVRSVGGPSRIDDRTKNHRFFEAAIALGAVGTLTGDRTLTSWSAKYAWKGIRMQRPDGVMPEDGGHDSGYQAQGMVSAARYLQLVATGTLHAALLSALQRGERWELSRILPDGSIDQRGDTRTAGCREHDPSGHCKTAFYAPIFSALAHWAAISGDAHYAAVARLVWKRSGYGG